MGQEEKNNKLTRRAFLKHGTGVGVAGAALGPMVLNLAACSDSKATDESMTPGMPGGAPAGDTTGMQPGGVAAAGSGSTPVSGAGGSPPGTDPMTGAGGADSTPVAASAIAAGAVLFGLYTGNGTEAMTMAAPRLDFSWLKAGDSVLIKVASNSGNPHPSVTSPAGVRGMVAHLKSLGAGKVIVADQAGVEWVRNSAAGRFSSTKERWMTNGLIEQDTDVHFFDDQTFDAGYFKATPPMPNNWPRGFYLPNIIKEVDHILYMPRIGAHTIAGLTLAHKSAIGWLRDDSRHDLHNDAAKFYEKFTEVNYAAEIKDRFRMAVTVSEKVLLHGGPDVGTQYTMSPVLVIASTSMANHDAVASSVLVTLNKSVPVAPGGMMYSAGTAGFTNTFFAGGTGVGGTTMAAGPWKDAGSVASAHVAHPFEMGITKDRATSHGWELTGGKPASIDVTADGETMDAALMTGLTSHGEGMYKFG